ncbi:beta-ketoacyl synthase chain length factor [Wenzhouxiangella sp. EGI_FJ10409]|uniref:beta-ketoacyl synthase chain length factor n=1 Tax=Wenzhouxiangella sp. EGI_FJ10409 TaxID=3243767 RepID=UPI0035D536F5
MSENLRILGCGLSAPGLPDIDALSQVLAGAELGEEKPGSASISLLSPRERRRCPETVRLSMAAAEQACRAAGVEPAEPDAVFSSGMGDLAISDYMCRTLADTPDLLSPMRFHNSVHNAAAGYWSIGSGARGDVTALSGATDSLVAGLIEADSRVRVEGRPVLLVVYDAAADGPMRAVWPARYPFACAFVIGNADGEGGAMTLAPEHGIDADDCPPLPAALAERVTDNPAARGLHLLALALGHHHGPLRLAARQGPGLRIEAAA